MKPPAPPPFLARPGYRRRRLGDLARVLPVLGLALFLLPVLGDRLRSTSGVGLWLFACWAALIAAARLIAPGLSRGQPPDAGEEP